MTAVVGCAFLEGGNAAERAVALTCDSRGRLVHHNVSAYASITNFLAGARPLSYSADWLHDFSCTSSLDCHANSL